MARLRNFWKIFWRLVESDSVRPFIYLYYSPLLMFSVVAGIVLPLIHAHLIVADLPILLWVWVQVGATSAAMVGLWLRLGGMDIADMTGLMLRRDWLGLILQATGHGVMCLTLGEFELAVVTFLASGVLPVTSLVWWLLAYGAAAISPYVIGTGLLMLQCFRKMDKGRKLQAAVP